jgi:hypothetical protein
MLDPVTGILECAEEIECRLDVVRSEQNPQRSTSIAARGRPWTWLRSGFCASYMW